MIKTFTNIMTDSNVELDSVGVKKSFFNKMAKDFILLNSLDTSQGLKDITVINIIKNDTKSLNM